MKKAPFILILVITFIAEALACCFMLTRIKDIKTDPVKVNECMYSVTDNFGDTSKYDKQLDCVVLDNDGKLLYKTRDGLSESINEAIKTRGLILDLRDNPGGLVTAVMGVADRFLPEGVLFSEENSDGKHSKRRVF